LFHTCNEACSALDIFGLVQRAACLIYHQKKRPGQENTDIMCMHTRRVAKRASLKMSEDTPIAGHGRARLSVGREPVSLKTRVGAIATSLIRWVIEDLLAIH